MRKKTVVFDLRYYGQTIARITGHVDGKLKLSTKGFEKNNLRDFGCDIQLKGVDWKGPEAAKFRKYFKDRKGPRNAEVNVGNEEHRLESLWLTELQKQSNKAVPNTKAVEVGNVRFPMPPASRRKLQYAIVRVGHTAGVVCCLIALMTISAMSLLVSEFKNSTSLKPRLSFDHFAHGCHSSLGSSIS
jgi:hypothetical protein